MRGSFSAAHMPTIAPPTSERQKFEADVPEPPPVMAENILPIAGCFGSGAGAAALGCPLCGAGAGCKLGAGALEGCGAPPPFAKNCSPIAVGGACKMSGESILLALLSAQNFFYLSRECGAFQCSPEPGGAPGINLFVGQSGDRTSVVLPARYWTLFQAVAT